MTQTIKKHVKKTAYGDIKVQLKSENKQLETGETVKVYYITKSLEMGGTHKDPTVILGHSTSKDVLQDTFKAEKKQLENKEFSIEDVKNLEKKMSNSEVN